MRCWKAAITTFASRSGRQLVVTNVKNRVKMTTLLNGGTYQDKRFVVAAKEKNSTPATNPANRSGHMPCHAKEQIYPPLTERPPILAPRIRMKPSRKFSGMYTCREPGLERQIKKISTHELFVSSQLPKKVLAFAFELRYTGSSLSKQKIRMRTVRRHQSEPGKLRTIRGDWRGSIIMGQSTWRGNS